MPEVLFPEDMLPGPARSRCPCARGCAPRGHGPSSSWPSSSPWTTCRARARRPRPQHPVVVSRLDRGHHLRGGDLGRLPRPGHRPDGLAGRPVPACAHHRLGHVRVRPDGGRHGLGHQHLRLLPGPLRCRYLAVEHEQRPRLAAGGRVPHQRARAALRSHGHGAGPGAGRSARSWSGLIATEVGGPNGWRWAFYVLAIPILLVAVFAFRIPEPPRGQFEKKDVLGEVIGDTPPGRAVVRGGVRADHAHPHDQDRAHRLLGHRVRAVHRAGAGQPLPQAALRPRRLPARHHRHHRQRRACWSRCPSSGGTTTASTARTRRGHSRSSARSSCPSPSSCRSSTSCRTPSSGPIFSVPSGVLLLTAFSMIGPVLTSVAPYRLRGHGRGGGRHLRLLRRRHRRGGAGGAPRQRRRASGPRC